jgi:hypothetical protein
VNDKEFIEIDLLTKPRTTQRGVPHLLRRRQYWKVFSGNWNMAPSDRIIFHKESPESGTENASVIGSSLWDEFTFKVKFKMVSDSIKSPEGGVIMFFLFKNIKNHYSFHFCLFKQKIELIKRLHGTWTTVAARDYKFITGKEYMAAVSTSSGVHQCHIDGVNQIEIFDGDISKGCVGIGAKYCDIEFSHISVMVPQEVASTEGKPIG